MSERSDYCKHGAPLGSCASYECEQAYLNPAPSAVEAKGEYCEWCKSDLRHHDGCPDKPNPEPSAREFWVRFFPDGTPNDFFEVGSPLENTYVDKYTHDIRIKVIEHSAYQKLERELAEVTKWKNAFRDQCEGETSINERWQGYNTGLQKEIKEEREKVAGLSEALERIVGTVEQWTDEHGQRKTEEIYASKIAREALKRFGDGK